MNSKESDLLDSALQALKAISNAQVFRVKDGDGDRVISYDWAKFAECLVKTIESRRKYDNR